MPAHLSDLQKWMHKALLHPDATSVQDTAERLVPNPRLSAGAALAIYQRSYSLRIAACMREQFPALCHALGEELFNDFVADYVREAPPESYTLYDLGRRFARFLEANRPDRDDEHREDWIDFIVDMARFERAVFATFDCPGAEDLTLATPATDDHALRAQPSLSVDHYRFPVAWYYHQVREKRAPNPPEAQANYVAIVRKDYQTTTISLGKPHYIFLRSMCDGGDVNAALKEVAAYTQQTLAQVSMVWRDTGDVRNAWINAGFFVHKNT